MSRGTALTKRPARQLPASRRCPPPATGNREEQSPGDGPAGSGADLDAHIARLAADAPPLTSAQRDQLALILHRKAAPRAADPTRPGSAPDGPTPSDEAFNWPLAAELLSTGLPAQEPGE